MTTITDPEELRALRELDEKLRDFPGRYEVRLLVWHEGEKPPYRVLSSLRSNPPKNTLAHFRKKFGGDEGFVEDHRGRQHRVSVRHLANEDPDTTYILPEFRFTPEESRLEEWKAYWHKHFERFPPRRSSKKG
jgi:hypothetical protein